MATVLGLDIGKVRIGVAKSDELGMFAHPVGYIQRTSDEAVVAELKKIMDAGIVDTVVVGLPMNLDGTQGLAAEQIRTFVEVLEKHISCRFTFWDERLSTKEAMRYMQHSSLSGKKKRKKVDSLAAQIMLQNYLDCNK